MGDPASSGRSARREELVAHGSRATGTRPRDGRWISSATSPATRRKGRPRAFLEDDKGLILELGAGQGRDTIYFASMGLRVYALDYSENGLWGFADKAAKTDLGRRSRARLPRSAQAALLPTAPWTAVFPTCFTAWPSAGRGARVSQREDPGFSSRGAQHLHGPAQGGRPLRRRTAPSNTLRDERFRRTLISTGPWWKAWPGIRPF